MRDRCLASLRALVVVFAVGSLAPLPVAGQAQTANATATKPAAPNTWTPPLTRDGQPDMQGVWLNNSATPLERPKALEGRQFLTDDELTELKKRAARFRQNGSDFAPGDSLFLAALADVEQFKNPNATGGLDFADEKEFDNRTSLIVDPPDGKIPPRTAEGQRRENARVAAVFVTAPTGPEDLTNYTRCITYGVPRLGGNSTDYSSYLQIIQTHGYVVLHGELIHDARVIPLDGRPHLPENIRLWNGDSRGQWEGNTLVVDTTNFSAKSIFLGSAENLHLIERFTRVTSDLINYEITLTDPTTWTKPWTAVIRLKQSQDRIYEFACHEGSFEVIHDLLAGPRAEEHAAEAAAKRPK
jgi:hypothetical protein